MLESTTGNPLKRSRELYGLEINELGNLDPPTKRSKTWLDHMILSESTFVSTTATRIIYPLPKSRKVLQAIKISLAPLPTRAEAGRAADAKLKVAMSNRRKTNRSNQLELSKGSGQAASLAASLESPLSSTVSMCNPSTVITTISAVDITVFVIHEDTVDEEIGNLLAHSANALDISDHETRIEVKKDQENVPPTDENHAVDSAIIVSAETGW